MDWTSLPAYHATLYSRSQLRDIILPQVDFAKLCIGYHQDILESMRISTRKRTAVPRAFLERRNSFAEPTCVTHPSPLVRGIRIGSRFALGGTFTIGGVAAGAMEWIHDQRPAVYAAGIASIVVGTYSGVVKGITALDRGEHLQSLIHNCSEDESVAEDRFLFDTLCLGPARRAAAAADVLSSAQWSNIPLALTIAEESLYGLPNIPRRHQQFVARQIENFSNTLSAHDPHRGILISMSGQVREISNLGNRTKHIGREM